MKQEHKHLKKKVIEILPFFFFRCITLDETGKGIV